MTWTLEDGILIEVVQPFGLRIWREEGRLGWRGWVQHAGTGESITVQSLDELWAFIERRTGTLTDAARKG